MVLHLYAVVIFSLFFFFLEEGWTSHSNYIATKVAEWYRSPSLDESWLLKVNWFRIARLKFSFEVLIHFYGFLGVTRLLLTPSSYREISQISR